MKNSKALTLSNLAGVMLAVAAVGAPDDASATCVPPKCYPENPKPAPAPAPVNNFNPKNENTFNPTNKNQFNPTNSNTFKPTISAGGGSAEQDQQQDQKQEQEQYNNNDQKNVQQQGDQVINYSNNDRRQTPQVGTIQLVASGACPEGWGLGFSTPGVGGTFAKTNQSMVCLSQNAATAILNAGVASGDGLMIAGGLRALANIHFEIDYAIDTVYRNAMAECSAKALAVSPLLLARRGAAETDADGKITGYQAGIDCTEVNKIYRNFARPAPATAAALAIPATERQTVINNTNYIFLDEAKKAAGAARTSTKTNKAEDCVTVRIPQATSRTACVSPAMAEKNKNIWEIIKSPAPTVK